MSFENLTDICEIIKGKSFEDIKVWAAENNIVVKETTNEKLQDLYLLSLDKDFQGIPSNIQLQANGIIFQKETNKLIVACQPKMVSVGTVEELETIVQQRRTSDRDSIRVEYCEDGTMMRLYYYNDQWWTATSRCIDGKESFWCSDNTFDELFWNVFDKNLLIKMNKEATYIFVLLHKDNRIVVKHKFNTLVYAESVNINTLERFFDDVLRNVDYIRLPKWIPRFEAKKFESYFHFFKRGILIKAKKDNGCYDLYKMDFPQYSEQKTIRGNVPQMRMRYLELLSDEKSLKLLEIYYPENRFMFRMIKQALLQQVKQIHKLYIDSHVKHTEQVTEENMYYRTLRQLHAQYKTTNKPIKFSDVYNKVFSLNKSILIQFLGWQ